MILKAKDLKKGMRIELISNSYKVVEEVVIEGNNATVYFSNGRHFNYFPNEEIYIIRESECLKRGIKEYK